MKPMIVIALVAAACGQGTSAGAPRDAAIDTATAPAVDAAPDAAPDAIDAHPDAAVGPPALPRLIAPLSGGSVTQQRPTLRWVLGDGSGTPIVDLCRDRACHQPLEIAVQIAADQRSAVPSAALPTGWVYWRVRVVAGAQAATSRTWQLWVGATSARSPVDTSNGAVLDINGDGFADFVVGAPQADAVHVYLGSPTASAPDWNGAAPPARIELLTLDPAFAKFGSAIANAGDVNGDGFTDFLISSPGGASLTGVAYLYFGSATPRADDWNGIAPRQRITLSSPGTQGFAGGIASAGDVDGDGFADFLITGRFGVGSLVGGATWLYLGSATPTPDTWNAPTTSLRLELDAPSQGLGFDMFGAALAAPGDINGDGFADFVISDPATNTAYVYLGAMTLSAAAWNAGTGDSRLDLHNPGGTFSAFGIAMAAAGDLDGNGQGDFLITEVAPGASPNVHVYLSSPTASAARWNQDTSPDRIDLTSPDGQFASFGSALASADANGDGFADFVIGSPVVGKVHLYLGGARVDAARWNGATAASRVDLASPGGVRFGSAIGGGGDVNGDGFADFTVGADSAGTSPARGAAYLLLGSAALAPASWSGPTANLRRDLIDPDGDGAEFGAAVAQ